MAHARPSSRKVVRLLAAAALLAALSAPGAAQPSEAAVKAAFLSKFAGYLTWPPPARPAAGTPYRVCIVGSDPFGPTIEGALRGQQVNGHPLQLRRLGNAAAAEGCHVAFLRGTAAQSTSAMLQALRGKPVLTVTDARAGGPQGMIHFVLYQGRVRFHVDEAMASRSGLAIDSRLLGVALSVKRAH